MTNELHATITAALTGWAVVDRVVDSVTAQEMADAVMPAITKWHEDTLMELDMANAYIADLEKRRKDLQ